MTLPTENHRFSPLSVSDVAETSTPLVSRVLPQYPYEQYAILHTQHAQRYVQRLSKHFAHKVLVESDTDKSTITFAMGMCILFAYSDTLCMHCGAEIKADIDDIINTLDKHTAQFANDPTLSLRWLSLTQ